MPLSETNFRKETESSVSNISGSPGAMVQNIENASLEVSARKQKEEMEVSNVWFSSRRHGLPLDEGKTVGKLGGSLHNCQTNDMIRESTSTGLRLMSFRNNY
ncbi:hypothetical protein D918_07568 [Trichuris suis]|nr:hypothetical protein D918_07568 [Trichuris suis]